VCDEAVDSLTNFMYHRREVALARYKAVVNSVLARRHEHLHHLQDLASYFGLNGG